MYPEVYSNGNLKAILNNMISNNLNRRINNKYLFKFSCFEQKYKSEYLTKDNQIHIDDQYFDMNYIEITHDNTNQIIYNVEAEHVSYRLIETTIDRYANTGTPTEILTDLLSGTEFSVGTVDFTSETVFSVNREASKLDIIIALAKVVGGKLDFSGYSIDIKDSIGQDNGYEIRIKKNLVAINKIIDDREELKYAYDIDFVNLNESDYFINNGLKNLETVSIGDTVTIKDETMGINITQEILETERDVIKAKNINCKVTNTIDLLTDSLYSSKLNNVKKDEVIYGVKINNDVGIEIERDDQLARTKLNGDEFKMQTGDGTGNYTDALYFDPIEGKYIFVGQLNATNIVGGTIIIADDFEVDENGHLTATNATFSGTITGTTITGGTITGTTFKTNASGERIEISGNELNTYNSSGNKEGFQIVAPDGLNFSMAQFWDNGQLQLEFFNSGGSSEGYGIRPRNGKSLGIGTNGVLTEFSGLIDINNANELKIPVISSGSVPSPEEGLIFIVEDFSNGPSIIFACDDGSGTQRWFTTQQGIPY